MLILRDHRRLCDIEWTTILILELVWHFPAVNMQTNPDQMQLHYRKDWYEQKTHRFTMQTILIKCDNIMGRIGMTWWRHQTETFSALLAICSGISPVSDEFPAQRPVTRSFDVFLDLSVNKRLSKKMVRLVIWDAIVPMMTSLQWTKEGQVHSSISISLASTCPLGSNKSGSNFIVKTTIKFYHM